MDISSDPGFAAMTAPLFAALARNATARAQLIGATGHCPQYWRELFTVAALLGTPWREADRLGLQGRSPTVMYHRVRFMTPISDQCESVERAVSQALYEASEYYASPKKITENGQVVWDSDLQDLDDFAESIGINPDYY